MNRGIMYVGGTYRFTVECFDAAGVSVALDSAPTFVVVKNGTPTMDAVTAVDRDSDGKHYDCSYNPFGEVETDHYEIRITVEISAIEYVRPSEHFDVVAAVSDLTDAVEALPTVEEIQAADRLVLVATTIAALTSQTSFTLAAGSGDNDAYKNCFAIITDAASSVQKSVRKVTGYVGSSKTVTLESAPDFSISASDSIAIVARVGGANVTLTALTLVQANQADSGEIRVKVGETCSYTLSILASDKSLADLSDATLKITINNDAGETVATVEAADITGSGALANPITFDLPSAATAAPTNAWIASIADEADGDRVLWDGPWIVERTARES